MPAETLSNETPAVQPLSCPACGGSVALRAAGYSVTVGCEYCGSILDVADPLVKLITRYHEEAAALEIPLGTRGSLDGVEWEAIGHLNRSVGGGWPWEEYLLFNPYHGYRWLVSNGRGWSFGEMLTRAPDFAGFDALRVGDLSLRRFFADSEARVDRVVGEFYWRVQAGERVNGADWVCPGWMLSRESNGSEVSWTLSRYVPPEEMTAAFGVEPPVDPWPPLPHQPSPWIGWLRRCLPLALLAVGAMLLAMIALGMPASVGSGSFAIAPDGREQSGSLGPIVLTQRYQRVDIRAEVPQLENGWVDVDFSLVDRATQRVYDAYGAAERYSGSDADGAWTEGSRGVSVSIASVPAGSYDLVVDYQANRWTGSNYYSGGTVGWMAEENQPMLIVSVYRGGVFFANFLIAFVLIALPLLWGLFRHLRFEQARQAESDFAPTGAAAMFNDEDDE